MTNDSAPADGDNPRRLCDDPTANSGAIDKVQLPSAREKAFRAK
jgi:hypothetical protein